MRSTLILLMIGSLAFQYAGAADIKYPASEIPEEMKKGMYAVIREGEQRFTIRSKTSSSLYCRSVITILRSQGNRLSKTMVWYDKMRKVDDFKASVYDADGKLVKRMRSGDIEDMSATASGTLVDDSRIKYVDLSYPSYPYTIEVEYSLNFSFLYDAPDFDLIEDDEVSIMKSSYTVAYPSDLKPRYKLIAIPAPKVEAAADHTEKMVWEFKDVKPDRFEAMHPDNTLPSIKISPNDFVFGGYAGTLKSWQEYGTWQAALNKGRDVLPEATIQKVKSLTANSKTTEEKARVLYEYMQSRTRYVSVQLGIGGFQPMEAKLVDQSGYGDCKGLSNYMIALLKAADVKAYYTTIMAGARAQAVIEDFPSDQSNHIIVAVPNARDTIWLECTSQTNPFGYIGRFTSDRKAMLVSENGGKLVSTPRYTAIQNTQIRTAKIDLLVSGDATAKVKTISAGLEYDDVPVDASPDDQKKWLQQDIEIPSFDIGSFKINNNKGRNPDAVVDVSLSLRRYASSGGKRIFFCPNLMTKSRAVTESATERKSDIFIRNGYTQIDTIEFRLPDAVHPEFVPPVASYKGKFGEYDASYVINSSNTLVYIRRLRVNRGTYPKETYKEYVEFFRNVSKADNAKVVLLTKT